MSKYGQLWKHLHFDGRDTFKMTYDEIKAVLGFDIDITCLTPGEKYQLEIYPIGNENKPDYMGEIWLAVDER